MLAHCPRTARLPADHADRQLLPALRAVLHVSPAVYGMVAVLLAVWPVDAGSASSVRWIGGSAGTRCRVTETAGSVSGSSDCAGESHRPVRVLAAVYRWDILVT